MLFRIFTLHPDIFSSFFANSLIAKGLNQEIIRYQLVNWREKYGLGNYKQVDDKPFGGGSGMVLQTEPIYQALTEFKAVSQLYINLQKIKQHHKVEPNNALFYQSFKNKSLILDKVTISLTPRGFPLNQKIVEWLAGCFQEINILCGRYEGFDARVSEFVDLELSLGSFVTNGGEVPAMALIEAVSRLVPGFVTKNTSVLHDSFSSQLNEYQEQKEFIVGKKKLEKEGLKSDFKQQASIIENLSLNKPESFNLFSTLWWKKNILPFIEHPQYTRPEIWQNIQVPEVLLSGDHKKIQKWRQKWHDST